MSVYRNLINLQILADISVDRFIARLPYNGIDWWVNPQ